MVCMQIEVAIVPLERLGLGHDIAYCAAIDTIRVVPRLMDGTDLSLDKFVMICQAKAG